MELLLTLFAGLLGLPLPAGFIGDTIAENQIRDRFEKVEKLVVRIDNPPTHQLLQGKVEKIRIAGRGLWLTEDIRVAAAEVETDPLHVNLKQRSEQGLPQLEKPLQAGFRIVVEEADINRALGKLLSSEELKDLSTDLLSDDEFAEEVERYEVQQPRVTFLPNNRLRVEASLRELVEGSDTTFQPYELTVTVETGLGILEGRRLDLIAPKVEIWRREADGREIRDAAPEELLDAIATGVEKEYDLRSLQKYGITARLLKLAMQDGELEIAAFVRVEPVIDLSDYQQQQQQE